jgi:hypothetical protein
LTPEAEDALVSGSVTPQRPPLSQAARNGIAHHTGFPKRAGGGALRFTIAPGWQDNVYAGTDALFLTQLGPQIWTDARALCPVFGGANSTATQVSLDIAASLGNVEPGALRDSIEFHLSGHSLIVSASGSSDRSYAFWVETGHNVVVFGRPMGYRKGPSPFLRPALYAVRSAA